MIRLPQNYRTMSPDARDRFLQMMIDDFQNSIDLLKKKDISTDAVISDELIHNTLVDANTVIGGLVNDTPIALTQQQLQRILFAPTVNIITDDYAILDNDGYDTIILGSVSADKTVTLPTLADNIGRKIKIINNDNDKYLTVDGEGSETIQGVTSIVIDKQYAGIEVVGATGGWLVTNCINCELLTIAGAVELIYTNYYTGTTAATGNFSHGIANALTKITMVSIRVYPDANNTYHNFYVSGSDYFYSFNTATTFNIYTGGAFVSKTYYAVVKYYI